MDANFKRGLMSKAEHRRPGSVEAGLSNDLEMEVESSGPSRNVASHTGIFCSAVQELMRCTQHANSM